MRWILLTALLVLSGFTVSVLGGDWPQSDLEWRILAELRWPRAMAALLVGSVLGVCGLFLQVVLRNPLAEPYILGVSGGASVAVMLSALVGLSSIFLPIFAMIGALATLALLLSLTRMGRSDPIRLLLTGVLLSAGAGAMGSLILTFSDPVRTQVSLVWLMGDLSGAGVSTLWLLPWLGFLVLATRASRLLDVFNRGPDAASMLGMNVVRVRSFLIVAAGLLTALAVSVAGPIGFIGLLVPHAGRLLMPTHTHRTWLPMCAGLGGALLLWADWLGRAVADPIQIPAGVVMAMLGIPVLLVLLGRIYASR